MKSINIDGVEYMPVKRGNREIVVVDRGWIFAGDVTRHNGRIMLRKAIWVFRWGKVGFAAVIADPVGSKADLRGIDPVDIPESSEIFSIPVRDDWGLE